MEGVTLTAAIIFAVLAVMLRPSYALAVYIATLLWYPNYLTVSIGTIDITAGRIVASALLLRCLVQSRIRSRFVWFRLDTWVALSMVVYVGTLCITQPSWSTIENRSGFLIDTWFAYMIARFTVMSRLEFATTIKCVAVTLAPLAVLGVAESMIGWRPFALLCGNSPDFLHLVSYAPRWGLTRATGPFGHSILFGSCFAIFLPLVYYLRHQKNRWQVWAYIVSVVVFIGVLSSMSSGPWIMVTAVIFCLAMEKYPIWIKPALIGFGLLCVLIAIVSNRPFYHVIFSYMDPLGGSGWHRAKLIDLAVEHFGEWWFLGYGGNDPGWGDYLGAGGGTDVTNEFILAGIEYGILGIIALCGVLTVAFRGVLSAYKKTADQELKSLYWSFGSVLFSVAVVWMSVSFFGQIRPLFYCILGMMGSSTNLIITERINFYSPKAITKRFNLKYKSEYFLASLPK